VAKWTVERRKDGLVAVKQKYKLEAKDQDYKVFDCGAEEMSETDSVLDWAAKQAAPCDILFLDGQFAGVVLASNLNLN
jgi:hypothetical protein